MGIIFVFLACAASAFQTYRSFHADPNVTRNRVTTFICLLVVISSTTLSEIRRRSASSQLSSALTDLKTSQQRLAELEKSRADAQIETWFLPRFDTPEMLPDKPFFMNFVNVVRNNRAQNVSSWVDLSLIDGPLSKAQSERVWKDYWTKERMELVYGTNSNQTLPENERTVQTRGVERVPRNEYEDLLNGRKTLYAIKVVKWQNPRGSTRTMAECLAWWDGDKSRLDHHLMWHICPARSPIGN